LSAHCFAQLKDRRIGRQIVGLNGLIGNGLGKDIAANRNALAHVGALFRLELHGQIITVTPFSRTCFVPFENRSRRGFAFGHQFLAVAVVADPSDD